MITETVSGQRVLVTGGSGFIAIHCIVQLLEKGYRVRATLRSLRQETEVRSMLQQAGVAGAPDIDFVQAELSADAGWAEAAKDCAYVIHVASPTPKLNFGHEDEMIGPAREGVLRVFRAARNAKVKRIVLTSAIGAVVYGHPKQSAPFDEEDWTDLSKNPPAYQKSKTIAEHAAWDFINEDGNEMELSVINPAAVMGPVLGPKYSHSIYIVKNFLTGKVKGSPKINSCFVDVRDVADLHLRAMTHPAAKGERFIAAAGESIWLVDLARILKKNLGPAAAAVSVQEIPNTLFKLAALKDPTLKSMIPLLGVTMNVTSAKAIRLLGWSPRTAEESILASAESLIRLHLLDQ